MNSSILAFAFVPLLMMIGALYVGLKKADSECYSPLFIQIAGGLLFCVGVLALHMEPSIIGLVCVAFFALLFILGVVAGIYTKIQFKNECIQLITFGIKRKYEYRNIQHIEIKYVSNTQFYEEIIIVFPHKKIRINYLMIGFYNTQDFLKHRLKQHDLKVPWVHRKRGFSKRKQKKQNRYRIQEDKKN